MIQMWLSATKDNIQYLNWRGAHTGVSLPANGEMNGENDLQGILKSLESQ